MLLLRFGSFGHFVGSGPKSKNALRFPACGLCEHAQSAETHGVRRALSNGCVVCGCCVLLGS